ncbi:hypothetical protein [Albimonas pacifica]|uniref:Uncharacterized protein n=1 Tax=Albimonas pacifica TaxID=1114924 RepID=A0A1I3D0P4_9RHOB|nr:hypothetical protein [Albimonas pacifica]SFH80051.1 hypothetical protein SAMN05216258_102307 [Albimonas pacifica]
MPCFCHAPASAARMQFSAGLPTIGTPPLALQMAAALPALTAEPRADLALAAGMGSLRLPGVSMPGLGGLGATLSLTMGSFALGDLPRLEFQMQQMAGSFAANVWPRLGWLASLPLGPLMNLSLVARLALTLQGIGLDPFTMGPPAVPALGAMRFALTAPQLAMARMLAGLPPLAALLPALNLPPLGEGGAAALANHLGGLAALSPPALAIPMPVMMRLGMALEALGTIQAAFGPLTPATFGRISAMLRMWGGVSMALPLGALALSAQLDALPALEDVTMGAGMAGAFAGFAPPRLPAMGFLSVMLALQGGLAMSLDMPVFDQCALCPFA